MQKWNQTDFPTPLFFYFFAHIILAIISKVAAYEHDFWVLEIAVKFILLFSTDDCISIEDTILRFVVSTTSDDQELFAIENHSVTVSSLFQVSSQTPCSCNGIESANFADAITTKYKVRFLVESWSIPSNTWTKRCSFRWNKY